MSGIKHKVEKQKELGVLMSSTRHHGRYNSRPISLGAFFLSIFIFFTAVHLTLGEDLFTTFIYFPSVPGPRVTIGLRGLFFCALRHLSQLTAVYLPVEAMERGGFRLINSSISN